MHTFTRNRFFTVVRYAFLPGLMLCLLILPANAADVTAALQGTFPVVASPGDNVAEAFFIQVDVSGSVPPSPSNPSVIRVCTQDTLMPDGSITCDVQLTITLEPGNNYNKFKTDANGNTFPMLIPKRVIIHPDVECGQTYHVAETITSNPGSGVDLGDDDTRLDLPFSIQVECGTSGCTLTQGFWKNHDEAWPVAAVQLGNRNYSQAELLQILGEPIQGNGLISLACQLIAARLNQANGASTPASVTAALNSADLLIGDFVVPPVGEDWLDPESTGGLTAILDAYNNGETAGGPPHCQ
jgi:hypothetical protein